MQFRCHGCGHWVDTTTQRTSATYYDARRKAVCAVCPNCERIHEWKGQLAEAKAKEDGK